MGVISQLEEGHFFLEDVTAAVPIDLTNAISLMQLILCTFHSWWLFKIRSLDVLDIILS